MIMDTFIDAFVISSLEKRNFCKTHTIFIDLPQESSLTYSGTRCFESGPDLQTHVPITLLCLNFDV